LVLTFLFFGGKMQIQQNEKPAEISLLKGATSTFTFAKPQAASQKAVIGADASGVDKPVPSVCYEF
jgi:hypothetical protein